jgi:hypothetical protein
MAAKTPGQLNYEGYRENRGGHLPSWDDLPEDERAAWEAGAGSVTADESQSWGQDAGTEYR